MEFIENFIFVNSLLQQCKPKNFLLYVHCRHCWWDRGNSKQQRRSWKQLLSLITPRLCVQTNLLLGKLPAVKNCIPTPYHSLLDFSLAKRVAGNAEAPVGESLSFCEPLTESLFWPGSVPGADVVRVACLPAVDSVS